MPWDRNRPGTDDAKYRTPEHRKYRAALVATLKRDGALTCTARDCVMPTRATTNPDGSQPDGRNAGHNDDGTAYDGPQHRACNLKDGATRARARQGEPLRRWVL